MSNESVTESQAKAIMGASELNKQLLAGARKAGGQ